MQCQKALAGRCIYLKCTFFCTGMQLKVLYTDCCDHMAFTSRVTGTMREYDLIVALTAPQQAQVLKGIAQQT